MAGNQSSYPTPTLSHIPFQQLPIFAVSQLPVDLVGSCLINTGLFFKYQLQFTASSQDPSKFFPPSNVAPPSKARSNRVPYTVTLLNSWRSIPKLGTLGDAPGVILIVKLPQVSS